MVDRIFNMPPIDPQSYKICKTVNDSLHMTGASNHSADLILGER